MLDYIYNAEPERFSFLRVPKILLQHEAYAGISAEAKLLYSLLFDRTELSNRNGWLDDQERVFGDYGRLIFPVNSRYYSGSTLGDLSLTWYSHIDPEKTVEITNYMKSHALSGDTIFYDIYTEEES